MDDFLAVIMILGFAPAMFYISKVRTYAGIALTYLDKVKVRKKIADRRRQLMVQKSLDSIVISDKNLSQDETND